METNGCTRRKLYGPVFGQEFDSPRLHQIKKTGFRSFLFGGGPLRRGYPLPAVARREQRGLTAPPFHTFSPAWGQAAATARGHKVSTVFYAAKGKDRFPVFSFAGGLPRYSSTAMAAMVTPV